MKTILLFISLFMSFASYADLAEKFQARCEQDPIKSLIGEQGSCRIVVAPIKENLTGICYGSLKGIPCKLEYGSSLIMSCGDDEQAPIVNIDNKAAISKFQLGFLLKTDDGKKLFQLDETRYANFIGPSLKFNLQKVLNVTTSASILLTYLGETVTLTDVRCDH